MKGQIASIVIVVKGYYFHRHKTPRAPCTYTPIHTLISIGFLRSLKRIVPWSFRRLLIFSIAFSKYFVLFFFATLWSIYCFFFSSSTLYVWKTILFITAKELTVAIERPTTTIEYSASDYIILMIQKQLWLQEFTTTMVFKNKNVWL